MTPSTPLRTSLVTRREELEQILQLQAANLRDHVSPEQAVSQGFLTVAHTLEVLERMHALAPSVIAKDGEKLAGYALVMPVEAAIRTGSRGRLDPRGPGPLRRLPNVRPSPVRAPDA